MGDVVEYLNGGLPELLALISTSDVLELELCDGDLRVRLHRSATVEGQSAIEVTDEILEAAQPEPRIAEIVSPLVGTFYRAGQPGIPPLVSDGSRVEPDTVVGYVDVLGEPSEVESGFGGEVTRTHATDGQPVEYGQTLFEVLLGD